MGGCAGGCLADLLVDWLGESIDAALVSFINLLIDSFFCPSFLFSAWENCFHLSFFFWVALIRVGRCLLSTGGWLSVWVSEWSPWRNMN